MKKILSLVMSCIIVSAFPFTGNADEINKNTYEINNVTVVFQDNSIFSAEEQEAIADYLVNGDSGIELYNLLCTVFGHKNESEIVTAISHKVRDTAPRCLNEKYAFHICSRCGNKSHELISGDYVYCCP